MRHPQTKKTPVAAKDKSFESLAEFKRKNQPKNTKYVINDKLVQSMNQAKHRDSSNKRSKF